MSHPGKPADQAPKEDSTSSKKSDINPDKSPLGTEKQSPKAGSSPQEQGPPRNPGRRRRRWRRVLLTVTTVVAVLTLGAVATTWAYGRSLDNNVKRTDVFSGLPSRPSKSVTGAMNVLVLGSDSRDPGNTAKSRSDTIMLLHINAAHDHAYIVSIPRDTWLYVPKSKDGTNGDTEAKINSAYSWGGSALTVQTVEKFTGVRIDHVVEIDFAGFKDVVDALGGVDLTVDETITSIHPPYRTFTKGTHHFNGAEALDYVRQRYQFQDGDFTRAHHQQQLLTALLDKAASTNTLTNLTKLNAFLQSVTRAITVDSDFSVTDLALQFRNLRSNDITAMISPSAGTGWAGDESVVYPDTEKAAALYAAVRDDNVKEYLAENPSLLAAPKVTKSDPGEATNE